jgi:hypothetical protein
LPRRLADDQKRILIVPWTPPSPYRRREIIQGEGEQPSAMRPMRTKVRAILIDALRDTREAAAEGRAIWRERARLRGGLLWALRTASMVCED